MSKFKAFVITISWFWLLLFALIPLLLITLVSVMSSSTTNLFQLPLTLTSYRELADPLYLQIFLRSLGIATLTTTLTLLLSYPFAYTIARTQSRHRTLLMLLVIVPFWTSSLIRTYAIMAILKANGLLNTLLLKLGLIEQPLQLLYTNTAMLVGLIYTLLPFMILPLYANMDKLDYSLIEAAKDLGANSKTIFLKILIPLTMPGIITGSILVFLPAMTLFYIPALLGGSKSILLGNLIQSQFLSAINWPMGAAMSIVLLTIMLLLLLVYWRNTNNNDRRELV